MDRTELLKTVGIMSSIIYSQCPDEWGADDCVDQAVRLLNICEERVVNPEVKWGKKA